MRAENLIEKGRNPQLTRSSYLKNLPNNAAIRSMQIEKWAKMPRNRPTATERLDRKMQALGVQLASDTSLTNAVAEEGEQ